MRFHWAVAAVRRRRRLREERRSVTYQNLEVRAARLELAKARLFFKKRNLTVFLFFL